MSIEINVNTDRHLSKQKVTVKERFIPDEEEENINIWKRTPSDVEESINALENVVAGKYDGLTVDGTGHHVVLIKVLLLWRRM